MMTTRAAHEGAEFRVFDRRLAGLKLAAMSERLKVSSVGPGEVMWGAPLHYRTAMRELYLLLDSCWSIAERPSDRSAEVEDLLYEEAMYGMIHSNVRDLPSGLLEVWTGQRSGLRRDLHLSDDELWRYAALMSAHAYTDDDTRKSAEIAATIRASFAAGLLHEGLQ